MNKVILIGNLTRDPELSHPGDNGTACCRFTLAVSRRYADKNGERKGDYINIVVWRELAELCGEYLAKGRKAAVIGSLQTRSYDGQDGLKRYVTEVVADEVEFLGSKPSAQGGPPPEPPPAGRREDRPQQTKMDYPPGYDEDDELPF